MIPRQSFHSISSKLNKLSNVRSIPLNSISFRSFSKNSDSSRIDRVEDIANRQYVESSRNFRNSRNSSDPFNGKKDFQDHQQIQIPKYKKLTENQYYELTSRYGPNASDDFEFQNYQSSKEYNILKKDYINHEKDVPIWRKEHNDQLKEKLSKFKSKLIKSQDLVKSKYMIRQSKLKSSFASNTLMENTYFLSNSELFSHIKKYEFDCESRKLRQKQQRLDLHYWRKNQIHLRSLLQYGTLQEKQEAKNQLQKSEQAPIIESDPIYTIMTHPVLKHDSRLFPDRYKIANKLYHYDPWRASDGNLHYMIYRWIAKYYITREFKPKDAYDIHDNHEFQDKNKQLKQMFYNSLNVPTLEPVHLHELLQDENEMKIINKKTMKDHETYEKKTFDGIAQPLVYQSHYLNTVDDELGAGSSQYDDLQFVPTRSNISQAYADAKKSEHQRIIKLAMMPKPKQQSNQSNHSNQTIKKDEKQSTTKPL